MKYNVYHQIKIIALLLFSVVSCSKNNSFSPLPPQNFYTITYQDSIVLKWEYPLCLFDSFIIYRSDKPLEEIIETTSTKIIDSLNKYYLYATTTSNKFVDKNVEIGKRYYYHVRTVYEGKYSKGTEELSDAPAIQGVLIITSLENAIIINPYYHTLKVGDKNDSNAFLSFYISNGNIYLKLLYYEDTNFYLHPGGICYMGNYEFYSPEVSWAPDPDEVEYQNAVNLYDVGSVYAVRLVLWGFNEVYIKFSLVSTGYNVWTFKYSYQPIIGYRNF